MDRYNIVDYYDVWSDGEGGWQVNDVARTNLEIRIPHNDTSTETILRELQRVCFLRDDITAKDISVSGDCDWLEVSQTNNDYPLCRLERMMNNANRI